MDNSEFISSFARRLDINEGRAASMVRHISDLMLDRLLQGDAVAIPAFGRFAALKNDEYISVDSDSGNRTLYPPEVHVEFTAGAMLKKSLNYE